MAEAPLGTALLMALRGFAFMRRWKSHLYWREGEFGDIEETHVGDFDGGDDGKGHEAKRHEWIHVVIYAKFLAGKRLHGAYLLFNLAAGLVCHESSDFMLDEIQYLAALDDCDSSAKFYELFDCNSHVAVAVSNDDYVV